MAGEIRSCPFCGGSAAYWHTHNSRLDRQKYELAKCLSCRSAFVCPPPSAAYLSRYYQSEMNTQGGAFDPGRIRLHYEQILADEHAYPNGSVDARRLAEAARRLAAGNALLDIGAGFGFFTNAAMKAGFDCTAIEPNENNAAVFELMNDFRPLQSSLDDRFRDEHADSYDVILMSQVLEHVPDAGHAVRSMHAMLRTGGVCVIAVPHFGSCISRLQGKRDMFITPPEHVNFFSMRGLLSIFGRNGFRCAEAYTISRYDRNKLARRLKPRLVADIAYRALHAFMAFSDARKRGMFINALFVKESSAPDWTR